MADHCTTGAAAPILPTRTAACPVSVAQWYYCSHCGHSGDYAGTGPHACPGCETKLLLVEPGAAPAARAGGPAAASAPVLPAGLPAYPKLLQHGAVVFLAGADNPAIQQHPPRGRRPKHVLSLWRGRLNRSQAVTVFALEAQHALALKMRHDCHLRCVALTAERMAFEELDKAITVEYKVLARQVKAIEAQIAQAAKCGAV